MLPCSGMGAAADDPMIGTLIAEKYKLLRRIGAGGMGVVYEAEHAVTHRRVAVKLLSGRDEWAPGAIERFLREARVAAMIGHPNIIEVLDAGSLASGLPYIVLTLLHGESLAAYLQRAGAIAPREAAEIACEILEALVAAHARHVVHRDIKPENVFVSTTASARRAITLLDFGISKVVGDEGRDAKTLTKTGSVLGTADYMSPEQVRGDDDIDGRADVWAVGVVLYRMVTGKLPFTGKNYNLVVYSVLTDTPPAVQSVATDVPATLANIIERAMTKPRERRMESAAAMLAALRAALDSPEASGEGAWTRVAVDALERGRQSAPSVEAIAQAETLDTVAGASAVPVAVPRVADTLAAQEAPTRDRGASAPSSRVRTIASVGVALALISGGAFWYSRARSNTVAVASVSPVHRPAPAIVTPMPAPMIAQPVEARVQPPVVAPVNVAPTNIEPAPDPVHAPHPAIRAMNTARTGAAHPATTSSTPDAANHPASGTSQIRTSFDGL